MDNNYFNLLLTAETPKRPETNALLANGERKFEVFLALCKARPACRNPDPIRDPDCKREAALRQVFVTILENMLLQVALRWKDEMK